MMGFSLDGITERFPAVLVVYDAEIGGKFPVDFLECMTPANHMQAGYNGLRKHVGKVVGERFEVTVPGIRRRQWSAVLSRAEWLIFADRFLIDLNEYGYPVRYEDTMGLIDPELGHLFAVAVDNTYGWEAPGATAYVKESTFTIGFAHPAEDVSADTSGGQS